MNVFGMIHATVTPWKPEATLEEIRALWEGAGMRAVNQIDRKLTEESKLTNRDLYSLLYKKASLLNFEGHPRKAYQALEKARPLLENSKTTTRRMLYDLIFLQGVTGLRLGENENCIMCRGESSCIIPISAAAVHTNPEGSRLAIKHFTEYLNRFPDDLGARWLLNLAHMTLGEHPQRVDPRFLVPLDHFLACEFDIGRFRDIGHVVGLNRFNHAGGAIMEDFNNDGLLDIVTTSSDPTGPMSVRRNTGKGTFEDCTIDAGLTNQLGGLYCVQTDYNNDGYMDIWISRGAWMLLPIRPTLLRNNADGTFTDVTEGAGLLRPVNSISASWADYDNDGWLDLFVCCERQPSALFHNLGNGTFEEVSLKSGLHTRVAICKGSAWIDYDNDGFQDLFLNYLKCNEGSQLFHNNRDGTFADVTSTTGIDGPFSGFSCWAWDYDNDGWQDIFATYYDLTVPDDLEDVVNGLLGRSNTRNANRLYRNRQGNGFEDVTREAGLDMVFQVMGSNFGDFDNDGFLDMYLGTGGPKLTTLVPNRMFKNVNGRAALPKSPVPRVRDTWRKRHAVACGDWDRDGDTDIFIEMGGPVNGDQYHNILFQNPGSRNHSLTVKLKGQQTNRAAIGTRIKVVTAGDDPQTCYRHVSSGSSFGANSLQQTIGLGNADRVQTLEIYWPTSGTTQVFHDVAADQAIEMTEFAEEYQRLNWQRIPLPEGAGSTAISMELR